MKLYRIAIIAAASIGLSSCVGDLDVSPIDESVTLADEVLANENDFLALLAKCYQGLAVSGSDGPDGSPDIDGIDGGFGQYLRALFYMQEFPTDEALITWNDQTVADLHNLSWTTSDVFVRAMFSRIYYQVSLCNELIRRADASGYSSAGIKAMVAEARALRALSYYHAIDIFGNVPFTDENFSVGVEKPAQMKRPELFRWLDDECAALVSEGNLKAGRTQEYGRLDVNFVKMLRAHLNLNARVYLGLSSDAEAKQYYDVAGTLCKEIRADYPSLHGKYSDLFCASNEEMTDEIIFAVEQDGTLIQTYGGSCFIIKASCKGGDEKVAAALGIDDGWGGTMVTPEFIGKFSDSDARKLFWGVGASTTSSNDITDYKNFDTGWSAHKFTNLDKDGNTLSVINFPSTDVPIFRSADAYLMLAEAQLRGATTVTASEGQAAWDAVRARAGLGAASYTLDEMLDERGRELYWECWRRSDLVRYNKLTTADYIWRWKGGIYNGQAVDAKYNLMPLPSAEVNSNSNLTQNEGYL